LIHEIQNEKMNKDSFLGNNKSSEIIMEIKLHYFPFY
jgi:hypothetical protein